MRNLRGLVVALAMVGTGAAAGVALSGCGGEIDGGASISTTQEGLTGCHGTAASSVPASGS